MHWYPISQNYVNGKLLGYTVFYRYYISWYSFESVNISSPNATQLTLKNLRPAQRYRISVAAFTAKGVGPRSWEFNATTGESIAFIKLHTSYIERETFFAIWR